MAGKTFGRYRLVRLLARGGMAEVYLAVLTGAAGFEKRLALKKILPTFKDLEEFTQLFTDEARISVTLNHSHIVQVFDFGVHNGEYFIAMEYVDGPDLEKLLIACRKLHRQLSIDAILYVATRAAAALEYAHSRMDERGRSLEIVHRDVSPPNILMSVQGDVKLTDFGVARYSQRISKSRPGVVRGKYAYMSPEQLKGEPLDHRSDLFSFGAVLYEMVTGVNPFLGDTDYQTMEAVVGANPRSPLDHRSDAPRDLVRIIRRCLEADVERRYANAGEVRRDLAELMFNRGVIDDPALILNEMWSLFPRQLARRGAVALRPRAAVVEDVGAPALGMPRIRSGTGVTTGQDEWGSAADGPAALNPQGEDDLYDEDDLTVPHLGNPDAIPTQPIGEDEYDEDDKTELGPPSIYFDEGTGGIVSDPFGAIAPHKTHPRIKSLRPPSPSDLLSGEHPIATAADSRTDDALAPARASEDAFDGISDLELDVPEPGPGLDRPGEEASGEDLAAAEGAEAPVADDVPADGSLDRTLPPDEPDGAGLEEDAAGPGALDASEGDLDRTQPGDDEEDAAASLGDAAAPESTPPAASDAPAPDADAPAQADDTPAQGDDTPAQDDDTPAKGEDTPAQDDDTPAKGDDTPAQGDDTPAQDLPAQDATAADPADGGAPPPLLAGKSQAPLARGPGAPRRRAPRTRTPQRSWPGAAGPHRRKEGESEGSPWPVVFAALLAVAAVFALTRLVDPRPAAIDGDVPEDVRIAVREASPPPLPDDPTPAPTADPDEMAAPEDAPAEAATPADAAPVLTPAAPLAPASTPPPAASPAPTPKPPPEAATPPASRPTPKPSPEPSPAATPAPASTPAPAPAPTPEPAPAATPAPSAASSRDSVALTVRSEPGKALLTVDGKRVGEAPWTGSARPGAIIEVTARLDGYLSTTRILRVGKEPLDALVTLSPMELQGPKKGTVSVTSTPWAYVSVDGRILGQVTPVKLDLAPGEHTIVLENPEAGWTTERKVTVVAGKATAIDVRK